MSLRYHIFLPGILPSNQILWTTEYDFHMKGILHNPCRVKNGNWHMTIVVLTSGFDFDVSFEDSTTGSVSLTSTKSISNVPYPFRVTMSNMGGFFHTFNIRTCDKNDHTKNQPDKNTKHISNSGWEFGISTTQVSGHTL